MQTPADLPPVWKVAWIERAAIIEYDGGQKREDAERLAFRLILEEMQRECPEITLVFNTSRLFPKFSPNHVDTVSTPSILQV